MYIPNLQSEAKAEALWMYILLIGHQGVTAVNAWRPIEGPIEVYDKTAINPDLSKHFSQSLEPFSVTHFGSYWTILYILLILSQKGCLSGVA